MSDNNENESQENFITDHEYNSRVVTKKAERAIYAESTADFKNKPDSNAVMKMEGDLINLTTNKKFQKPTLSDIYSYLVSKQKKWKSDIKMTETISKWLDKLKVFITKILWTIGIPFNYLKVYMLQFIRILAENPLMITWFVILFINLLIMGSCSFYTETKNYMLVFNFLVGFIFMCADQKNQNRIGHDE